MRIKKLLGSMSVTMLVAIPVFMLARSTGAPPRRTGGPGDRTCADSGCHDGPATAGSGVAIDFGGTQQYTPGQTYTWTVTITDPAARAWGFEASARPSSNDTNGQAGRFEPGQGLKVTCEPDNDRPAAGCPAAQPIEFITHNLPSSSNRFTFTWRAPDTNIGDVKVYVAGNAANGNFSNTGDRIYTNSYTLTAAGATNAPRLAATKPVFQVWDDSEEMSSGTWIAIKGENLSATTREWQGTDFQGNIAPTSLDGVRVNVNGKPAFVSYISPTQVNAHTPDDTALGPVNVEVINSNGTSNAAQVQRARISPALLTTPAFLVNGKQYAVALHANFGNPAHADFQTYVGPANLIAGVRFRPARPGDTIILYGVGCGPTNPATAAGEVPAAARPLALPFEVRFGETLATAQGFLAAQAVGLYQFNVTVPTVATGDVAIDLRLDGVSTGQTLVTTIGN